MTQFMLLKGEGPASPWQDTVVSRLSTRDEFLCSVAHSVFGSVDDVWTVADPRGRLELLVDQLWDAAQRGEEPAAAPFATFLAELVHRGVEFAIWCSDDFLELPTVTTWDELMHQLREQTAQQPADVWVRFRPPA